MTFINLLAAKAQNANQDEFAASVKFVSPDKGAFRIVFRDMHFDGLPLDLSSGTDFAELEISASGKIFKVAMV